MKSKLLCLTAIIFLFVSIGKSQENEVEYTFYEFDNPPKEIIQSHALRIEEKDYVLKLVFKKTENGIQLGVSYYNMSMESNAQTLDYTSLPDQKVFTVFYKNLISRFANKSIVEDSVNFLSDEDFKSNLDSSLTVFYSEAQMLLQKIKSTSEESNLGLSLENYALLKRCQDTLDILRHQYKEAVNECKQKYKAGKLCKGCKKELEGQKRATKYEVVKVTELDPETTKKLNTDDDTLKLKVNKNEVAVFKAAEHEVQPNRELTMKIRQYKRIIRKIHEEKAINVFLTGNALLNSSAEKDDKTDATSGIGIKVRKIDNYEFNATITVTESNDTIDSDLQRDYGKSILTPGIRKYSYQSCFRQYSIFPANRVRFMRKVGIGVDFNCTRYNWSYNDSLVKTVVPFAMDAILPYTWISISKPGKDIKISSEFGYAMRIIGGDLNDEERTKILGSPKVCYSGLQAGFNMRYNGLRIFYYILFFENKRRVEGLTHGQALAGISFTGTIDQIGGNNSKKVLKEIYNK